MWTEGAQLLIYIFIVKDYVEAHILYRAGLPAGAMSKQTALTAVVFAVSRIKLRIAKSIPAFDLAQVTKVAVITVAFVHAECVSVFAILGGQFDITGCRTTVSYPQQGQNDGGRSVSTNSYTALISTKQRNIPSIEMRQGDSAVLEMEAARVLAQRMVNRSWF